MVWYSEYLETKLRTTKTFVLTMATKSRDFSWNVIWWSPDTVSQSRLIQGWRLLMTWYSCWMYQLIHSQYSLPLHHHPVSIFFTLMVTHKGWRYTISHWSLISTRVLTWKCCVVFCPVDVFWVMMFTWEREERERGRMWRKERERDLR